MTMLIQKTSLVLFVVLLLSSACNHVAELNETERADYEAEYAIPLVNTSFSMKDVLEGFEENSVLTVLPDGLLRLQYSGNVLTETADDVFEAINETLSMQGLIPVIANDQALPFSLPDGLEVDRMDLKSGDFSYIITNCHDKAIDVTLSFPSATLNGVPLTITQSLPAYSGTGECPSVNNVVIPDPIDLSNYLITPINDSIRVSYSAVDSDGMSVDPSSGTFILIDNLAFTYLEGYLGQIDHSGDRDTIEIDFFDNWIVGDVYFEDPVITFHFENSFGLPTLSVINTFDILTVDGTTLPLESVHITEGVSFPNPGLDEVGEIKTKDFIFNKDNSNIREVLGAGPVAIDYDIDATTNPSGNTDIRGFVTDSSVYKVRVDVDLPLFGSAINFVARDTVAVDLNSFEKVDYAEFKLITENSMPVSIAVQGYFLNDNGTVLDSLFSNNERIIRGADVDAVGIPTGSSEVITFADFPIDRFAGIKSAKNIELVATFFTSTDGAQSVQVKDDQDVKIRMGAILGVSEK